MSVPEVKRTRIDTSPTIPIGSLNAAFKAISEEQKGKFRRLLPHIKDHLDHQDAGGQTLLHHTAKMGWDDECKLLLKHKSPQLQNHQKETPLVLAANHGHESTVKLLLDHGASTAVLGEYGSPAYVRAFCKSYSRIVSLLNEHHTLFEPFVIQLKATYQKIVRKANEATLLGQTFKLHAFSPTYMLFNAYDSLVAFRNGNFSLLPEAAWERVLKPFYNYNFSDEDSIELADPILCSAGWNRHVVIALFFKVKDQYFLSLGNRGDGAKFVGVKIYEIGNPSSIRKVIKAFSKHDLDDDVDRTNKMHYLVLIHSILKLTNFDQIKHSSQNYPNCTYSGVKMGLEMSVYSSLLAEGLSSTDAKQKAVEIKKKWSDYDRERSLNVLLSQPFLQTEEAQTADFFTFWHFYIKQCMQMNLKERRISILKILAEKYPELLDRETKVFLSRYSFVAGSSSAISAEEMSGSSASSSAQTTAS